MLKEESRELDRQEILNKVRDYAKKYLIQATSFQEGDRINYGGRFFDENEVVNLIDSSLDFWLTEGKFCNEFEKGIEEFLNVKHAIFVNSGSSANLLAFYTLTVPELKERQIKKGDEVITLSCGFPTTVSPIIQYGAVPVFADISLPTYNIDVNELEKALSNKTKAVMMAHTLGNPFDIAKVKMFCAKHNLWLIEDNCDALGSEACIDGEWKKTGTIGDIGTSSFYPPHHMTTGEGGAVYTSDSQLHKIARSLRDWGRDCFCMSGVDNTCKNRFTGQYGLLPSGYDHKYVYSHFGFNLKSTEMCAAIGCAQLKKIDSFVEKRRYNFNLLYSLLKEYGLDKYFILPEETANCKASWFGFLISCKENVDRKKVVSYIEDHNIQTRMLFAGNIIKHPCFDYIRDDTSKYRVIGNLANTDFVMDNTFWVGLYPGMTDEKIKYMAKIINESVKH